MRTAEGLVSPSSSTTRTSKRCGPSVSASQVYGVEHAVNDAPSSEHSEPTTPSDEDQYHSNVGRRSRASGVQQSEGAFGGVAVAAAAARGFAAGDSPATMTSQSTCASQ